MNPAAAASSPAAVSTDDLPMPNSPTSTTLVACPPTAARSSPVIVPSSLSRPSSPAALLEHKR
ncbi:hypothetical protein [Amycolatopsis regifaucium]|uniref:hypothetical protein n=1 Tax=Amycolatopsis regifaucium TaxID=546365 RepID=UPI001FC9B7D3|nr:hypothetical protein [Amycolatopsis regifaucium]